MLSSLRALGIMGLIPGGTTEKGRLIWTNFRGRAVKMMAELGNK